jgi:hypothetical protein
MKLDVDRLGSLAGLLCAVHCGLSGVALGILSVSGLGFIASPASEVFFIGTTAVVGLWAAVSGFAKHHSYRPLFVLGIGFVLIAISHVLGHVWYLSVIGAGFLVSFHVFNRRLITFTHEKAPEIQG